MRLVGALAGTASGRARILADWKGEARVAQTE